MCGGLDLALEYVQQMRRILDADSSPAAGVHTVRICLHANVQSI